MSKKSLYGYMRIKMKKLYTMATRRIYPNCLYIPLFRFLFSSLDTGGRVVRKCEKDFDRKVFSFLYILLDALPSTLNFRKRRGLLTNRIIVDKRKSCHASYESLKSFNRENPSQSFVFWYVKLGHTSSVKYGLGSAI
tara:strand:- start:51 stop:461 length:411 start_codon:yes stop_codon:yes gene_type:complete